MRARKVIFGWILFEDDSVALCGSKYDMFCRIILDTRKFQHDAKNMMSDGVQAPRASQQCFFHSGVGVFHLGDLEIRDFKKVSENFQKFYKKQHFGSDENPNLAKNSKNAMTSEECAPRKKSHLGSALKKDTASQVCAYYGTSLLPHLIP